MKHLSFPFFKIIRDLPKFTEFKWLHLFSKKGRSAFDLKPGVPFFDEEVRSYELGHFANQLFQLRFVRATSVIATQSCTTLSQIPDGSLLPKYYVEYSKFI